MFEQINEEVPFHMAIKCASATLQNKIISSSGDTIGILLFNTIQAKNPSNFEGIYILQDLDIPDVKKILELEDIVNGKFDISGAIGSSHDEASSLGNVFWTCSNLFSLSAQKSGYKRIFLFTNNDNPHSNNFTLRNGSKARAKDLIDLGIQIELFNLNQANHIFDISQYYSEIISSADDEQLSRFPDSAEKFAELMTIIRRKESKKRSLARLSLTVGPGMDIGCRILFNEAKKGQYIYLDSKTNSEVRPSTEWICKDTGSVLMPTDMKFYFPYGGEKAVFEKSEVNKIKYFGPPGLLLLGFKPQSRLKIYHNIRHSYFLVPDEGAIKGSVSFMAGLLEKLDEMGKMAICRFIARQNSPPRIVCLVPQREVLDEHGVQLKPPGFNLIFLPFADDLRSLTFPSKTKASNEQIDKAKEIVGKLTISTGYNYEDYENPILQKHYANLQALALDQDVPDEIEDHTEPNAEKMKRRAGEIIDQFKEMFSAESVETEKPKSRKRKTGDDEESRKAAKGKSTEDLDMKEISKDQAKLSKLTVPVLKEFLQSVNIKPGKLKADLVQQVMNYFASN